MVLAERTNHGLTVVLDWNRESDVCIVTVTDTDSTWELHPSNREEAQSMYFHPYAYTPYKNQWKGVRV